MKEEIFNEQEVKERLSSLEEKFTKFAETTKNLNELVANLIQNGDESAVMGLVGEQLLNIWDKNGQTFDNFYSNFETWSQTVSVISANNSEFLVKAEAIYRDGVTSLDGIEAARSSYRSGSTTIDDIIETASTYSAVTTATPETPATPDPSLTGTTSTGTVQTNTLTRGAVVRFGDKEYTYYGTASGTYNINNSKNIYLDESTGNYVYVDAAGNVEPVTCVVGSGSGYNYKIENINVTRDNIEDVLKGYSNGKSYSSVFSTATDSVIYDQEGMCPDVVSLGGEATSTYHMGGASSLVLGNNGSTTSNNSTLSIPTSQDAFNAAVNNHDTIRIDPGYKFQYDPSSMPFNATDFKVSGTSSPVYFKYDESTGLYYQADEFGNYSTSTTGYDPAIMAGTAAGSASYFKKL